MFERDLAVKAQIERRVAKGGDRDRVVEDVVQPAKP